MWASLIPGYQEANRNKKKNLKQEYRKMHLQIIDDFVPKGIKFDDCFQQSSTPECKKPLPRKGNENMYVEQNMTVKEKTTEDVRREHFLFQLDTLFNKRDDDLREKFGLYV